MNWRTDSRCLRDAGAAVALSLALSLAGCGGGGSGGDPAPVPVAGAGGTVSGVVIVPGGMQLTLRGASGLGRIVTLEPDGSFSASLHLLGGPYVGNAQLYDEATGTMLDLYAWSADGQGMAVSPLSTLQLAVLARQDPRAVYSALSQWTGVSFDTAQRAAADDAVAAYLQQYLGVDVPATVRGFDRHAWQAGSGDPFEAVAQAALAAALARGEDLGLLAQRLGRRSAACARQSAAVTVDGVARRFCPWTITRGPDPADAALELHRFDGDEDGVLEVRTRAGRLESVVHTLSDGRSYGCQAPDCSGAAMTDDRLLQLALALPAADSGTGSTRFAGTLASAAGTGDVLPAAECRSNRLSVGGGALAAQPECATTDDYGQGGQFAYPRGGSQRFVVDFSMPASSRLLSLSFEGRTLTSIVMSEFDATAGLNRYFACAGSACQGASVAAPAADPLDIGWQVQAVRLAATPLQRLRDDGTLDAADTRVLDAGLIAIVDPAQVRNLPSDCSTITPSISAQVDGDPYAYGICPPPDDASAATVVLEADGVTRTVLARSSNFESLAVTLAPDDRVLRAVLDTNNGQRFGCGRTSAGEPACTGISWSAPDAGGVHTLAFSGVRMLELLYGDFVGRDRAAQLAGEVLVPAAP